MINFGLYATYALIGISVLMILVFSISKIAGDPKGAITGLVGIGGLAIIILLAYAFSTGSDASTMFAKLDITEGTSHFVGTALFTFYLLGAATLLAILFAEVSRLFK